MDDEFRTLLQTFIRRFGLLGGDQTPCGKPLPPSDAHALMCLRSAGEDGLLQTALVEQLALDKSSVSRLVARLTEGGHVTAATAPDARARPIRLTRKGMKLAAEINEASHARFTTLLELVPARRRASRMTARHDLVDAIERIDPEQDTTP